MENGLTAISSIMDFFTTNETFSLLIGIAIAGVGLSAVLGIFFRR